MNGAFFTRSAAVEQVQKALGFQTIYFKQLLKENLEFFFCCCNAFYFSIRILNNGCGFSLTAPLTA